MPPLCDVRQGPDGLIYVITDEANGEILRLVRIGVEFRRLMSVMNSFA